MNVCMEESLSLNRIVKELMGSISFPSQMSDRPAHSSHYIFLKKVFRIIVTHYFLILVN